LWGYEEIDGKERGIGIQGYWKKDMKQLSYWLMKEKKKREI
jgi:hypothetical protein